ncbi:MAG TPA: sigma-70 family RNA polymerase sigma factor [Planctomycetota bacterium]|nr:sigma-70 family RNA polymerase sigma factor [Planctomycetota bacterium]
MSSTTNPHTAEQLFARYRDAGDLAALAAVFDLVAGHLLLVAGHLVRDGATAEDLVQTTFVEAMRHAGRFDARRPLLPWLAQILTHHARKLHRRERRGEPARGGGCSERSAADIVLDRETMAAIEAGLTALAPRYREVLTLRLVHELSPAAIAHAIGCPPETVKTRLKRGLEQLRRHLPVGLATSLAVMLAAGRGLAAVRADVLRAAKELATKATASGVAAGAGAIVLGGLLMKQLLLRATVLVAVALLGWWGTVAWAGGAVPSPRLAPSGPAVASADLTREPTQAPPAERTAASAPAAEPAGIVFFGRCVAAATGTPLAGVQVRVWRYPAARDRQRIPEDLEVTWHATSDAAGAFRCVCEPGQDELIVQAGGEQHVPRMRVLGPYDAPREVDLGDVPLTAGVRLVTRLVDRRGSPVPDAGVGAGIDWRDNAGHALFLKCFAQVRSDAGGRIVWPHLLPPGRYRIRWEDGRALPAERETAWMEVPASPAAQENVLVWPFEDVAHTIRGSVADESGRPMPGLDVGAEGGGTRGNAETRTDGTFVMPRVGPFDPERRGPVCFGLPRPAEGFELVGEPTCNWGDHDVRLVVKPAATLVVRAVDAVTGDLVPDVHVACWAHLDDAATSIAWVRPTTCAVQPDGSVHRKLARCVHDVQVFPKDTRYGPSLKLVWDPRDGSELTVPLARVRSCAVRVVTTDGRPVAGTEVWTLQPIEAVAGTPAASGWREVDGMPDPEMLRLDPTTRWARQYSPDDAPLGTACTDADGRATVVVRDGIDVVVAALGPGHVPKAIVGRATGDEIELVVARGALIRIEFSPAEIAARLGPAPYKARLRSLGAKNLNERGAVVWVQRVIGDDPNLWEVVASVDLDGSDRCTCGGLAAGEYQLYLSNYMQSGSPDGILVGRVLGRMSLRDGEQRTVAADLSALATGRLRGRVLVNGAPWVGSGTASSHPGAGTRGLVDDALVEIATDARGEFDVEVPAGEYRLRLDYRSGAGNAGYWRPPERARVVAGATTDAVFTARFVTARVRIVHATGEPAVGLTVTMDCTAEPKGWQWWTTDADGWITIEYVQQVPFTLVVANPDGPMRAGRRATSAGDAVLGPFQIPPTGDRAEFRGVLPEGWR